jgi:hypothetical protein
LRFMAHTAGRILVPGGTDDLGTYSQTLFFGVTLDLLLHCLDEFGAIRLPHSLMVVHHQKVGYVNYFLSFELLPDNDIPIASSAHVC